MDYQDAYEPALPLNGSYEYPPRPVEEYFAVRNESTIDQYQSG